MKLDRGIRIRHRGHFFTGLAGGLYALFMGMVPITVVELYTSTDFIIMSLLGGLGSLYGPIAGAVIIKIASEIMSAVWARWLLVMGVMFIVCILFARDGIWGMVTAVLEKRKGASLQRRRPQ